MHSYFNVSPESPDGRFVLYYKSVAADGHTGEVRLLERATNTDTLVCGGVTTEDAHRAACQQWVGDGRYIAWHDCREGEWQVSCMEVSTRASRVLARNRQLGFGTVLGSCVLLYGCHWNPGPHRGVEAANVETGEVSALIPPEALLAAHGAFVLREFGEGRPVSLFFPVAAPSGERLFFKVAAGSGGSDFRSPTASHRQGLVVFSVPSASVGLLREAWGHPAWFPDSRRLIEMEDVVIDSEDGATTRVEHAFPALKGSHPAISPDGRFLVKDGELPKELAQAPGEWGVVLCNLASGESRVLARSREDGGATSWRRNHPHPIFSSDSKRLYFNLNNEPFTRLWCAIVEE
jgi:hypothetical protein